ncbi:exodeoxyribonuclease III [Aureimonas jatrophae]|uniref:Exodeoxyribonuclease-3 n=1 Tax=Aureimonas jatrophae TaxID=1166073 RepID=A0A1H0MUD3_9HYPH|nr:exodeoxyribonuclease III [Aureimonas jatrophae]MBB3951228.1 exodeoxyribonuclease-3 [Aureimonas jatrophae]SDO83740.1 exodeoxyribonuclease-3 [Aureimonas jatrophae]
MLVATWNINGVKARLDALLAWLDERQPDVVGLQEIKSVDEQFPRAELEKRGWHVETHGQKGFNGVALLSKEAPIRVERRLPGAPEDEQSRFIEAVYAIGDRRVRVACLYLPNGNPLGTEKFSYKLDWMARLEQHARTRLGEELPFVLMGDYNVIPQPDDVRDPSAWVNDALYQPESRAAYRRLLHLGLTDAVRAASDAPETYTFWDYQAGSWPKNNGIRIDHVLLSPEAAILLQGVSIDRHVRGWEKPSDHVPVVVDLRS